MFCHKCGAQMPQEGNFCKKCGVSRMNVDVPQPNSAVYSVPKKSSALWKYIVAAVAVVILIGACVYAAAPRLFPVLDLDRAISNLEDDFTTRINNTPLYSLVLLEDIMNDGTMKVDFLYRGRAVNSSGNFTLMSNVRRSEYAIHGEVVIPGMVVDLEAYINSQRIAARSRLLDNNFYGITFSTFRRDLNTFGTMIGLDSFTISEIADAIELIEDSINSDPVTLDVFDPYTDIINRHMRRASRNTTRGVDIRFDGQTNRATRTSFTFTEDDIIDLLRDLQNQMENDDWLREQFYFLDNPIMRDAGLGTGTGFNRFMRDLDDAIRELERDLRGELIVSFYVGRGSHLLRLEVDSTLGMGWGDENFTIVVDFGAADQTTWQLDVKTQYDDFSLRWDYSVRSNRHSNIISFAVEDRWGRQTYSLSSEWNANNGDFTLSFDDGRNRENIHGNFTTSRNGFNLMFEEIPLGRDTLRLDITASSGTNIGNVDFINIDEWSMHLMDSLQRAIFNFIF